MTRQRLNAHGWLKGDIIILRRPSDVEVELLDDGVYEFGGDWGLWTFEARAVDTGQRLRVTPMVGDENLTLAKLKRNNLT